MNKKKEHGVKQSVFHVNAHFILRCIEDIQDVRF